MSTGLAGFGIGDVNYGDWSSDDGQYSGGYYIDKPWWADNVSQAINVFGGRVAGGSPTRYPYPYAQQQGGNGTFNPGSVTPSGFNINWQTALLLGLGVGAFFLGRRGR